MTDVGVVLTSVTHTHTLTDTQTYTHTKTDTHTHTHTVNSDFCFGSPTDFERLPTDKEIISLSF